MAIHKAVILAGGKGTRLRPLTFNIPKPLLPVGERSIVELLLERLRDSGVSQVILSLGYRGELVRAFCGDGSQFGVKIDYVDENEPLGTAGPLRLLGDRLEPGERLFLMNGDIVTALDFRDLARFHEGEGVELSVAYKELHEKSPFGVLQIGNRRLQGIVEKPTNTYAVSAGIYALDAGIIAEIPPDTLFTMPELATRLIDQDRPVGAFRIDAYWLGVERFPHLQEALTALQEVGVEPSGGDDPF